MIKGVNLKLSQLGRVRLVIPQKDPKLRPASGRKRKIIPVCEPKLSGNELKYISECVRTNWISSAGNFIKKFEHRFSSSCGAKYAVSCTNGTTALHLALATLGISFGDEVIIPTFTMIATANAITYLGAKPVLVDAEPRTWNIDT
ncbi:DegT/DnrJ/EryC1/StrS family aminotransferase, partial [Candidatus Omnitrophota bacterium]